MTVKQIFTLNLPYPFLPIIVVLLVSGLAVNAQSTASSVPSGPIDTQANRDPLPPPNAGLKPQPDNQPGVTAKSQPEVSSSPSEAAPTEPTTDQILKRIERARALAAAHQLDASAAELETVRATTRDTVLRDGTSVMLMGIYLESANYLRAQSLLEETFQMRKGTQDSAGRTYFALAGQAVNGLRSHLARYRDFGVNATDTKLPVEAATDVDRLRAMLERMAAQAREIAQEAPKAYEARALLEDVLGIRFSLARDDEDRNKWKAEYAEAREWLGSAQMQIASVAGIPSLADTVQARKSSAATKTPETSSASTNSVPETATPASGSNPIPVTTSPKTGDSQTVAGGLLNDRASKQVVPTYPQLARTGRVAGVVKVFVIVDESGKVQVTQSEGPILLRQAAEDAARQWRFAPTAVDGKPTRLSGYIVFTFTL